MVAPLGSFTCKPSVVRLLLTHLLCMCKKWPVVPESVIVNVSCRTAAAYGYDFFSCYGVAVTVIFVLTIIVSDLLYSSSSILLFFVVFDVHKLM